MANENEKPPLGCKPFYIPASVRICELAEAIDRKCSADVLRYRNDIYAYAREIISQCDLISDQITLS